MNGSTLIARKNFSCSVFIIGAHAAHGGSGSIPSTLTPLQRQADGQALPALCTSVAVQIERLKAAYRSTTKGLFGEALSQFVGILQSLCLVVVNNKQAKTEVEELLDLCREYITGKYVYPSSSIRIPLSLHAISSTILSNFCLFTFHPFLPPPHSILSIGLSMELYKKNLPPQKHVQGLELAAYFTHSGLQPIHKMLALRSAMKAAYRVKNFRMASSFATRLLELSPKPEIAQEVYKKNEISFLFCRSPSSFLFPIPNNTFVIIFTRFFFFWFV